MWSGDKERLLSFVNTFNVQRVEICDVGLTRRGHDTLLRGDNLHSSGSRRRIEGSQKGTQEHHRRSSGSSVRSGSGGGSVSGPAAVLLLFPVRGSKVVSLFSESSAVVERATLMHFCFSHPICSEENSENHLAEQRPRIDDLDTAALLDLYHCGDLAASSAVAARRQHILRCLAVERPEIFEPDSNDSQANTGTVFTHPSKSNHQPFTFVEVLVPEVRRLVALSQLSFRPSAAVSDNAAGGHVGPAAHHFLQSLQRSLAENALFPPWRDIARLLVSRSPAPSHPAEPCSAANGASEADVKLLEDDDDDRMMTGDARPSHALPSEFIVRLDALGEVRWSSEELFLQATAQSRVVVVSVPPIGGAGGGGLTPLRYRCRALLNAALPPIHLTNSDFECYLKKTQVSSPSTTTTTGNLSFMASDPTDTEVPLPRSGVPFVALCRSVGGALQLNPITEKHCFDPTRQACEAFMRTGVLSAELFVDAHQSAGAFSSSGVRANPRRKSPLSLGDLLSYAVSCIDCRNIETAVRLPASTASAATTDRVSDAAAVQQIDAGPVRCRGAAMSDSDSLAGLGISLPLFRFLRSENTCSSAREGASLNDSQSFSASESSMPAFCEENSRSRGGAAYAGGAATAAEVTNVLIIVDEEYPGATDAFVRASLGAKSDASVAIRSTATAASVATTVIRAVVDAATRALDDLVQRNIDVFVVAQEQRRALGRLPEPVRVFGPQIATSIAAIIHASGNADFKKRMFAMLKLLPSNEHEDDTTLADGGCVATQHTLQGLCSQIQHNSYHTRIDTISVCETEAALLRLLGEAATASGTSH